MTFVGITGGRGRSHAAASGNRDRRGARRHDPGGARCIARQCRAADDCPVAAGHASRVRASGHCLSDGGCHGPAALRGARREPRVPPGLRAGGRPFRRGFWLVHVGAFASVAGYRALPAGLRQCSDHVAWHHAPAACRHLRPAWHGDRLERSHRRSGFCGWSLDGCLDPVAGRMALAVRNQFARGTGSAVIRANAASRPRH